MYPFATNSMRRIVFNDMEDKSLKLIEHIQTSSSTDMIIQRLKSRKNLIFFRVGLLDSEGRSLYDTHIKKINGPQFNKTYITDHPEVREALEKGSGYHESYSRLIGQSFAYHAKVFNFQGETFILRTAFPLEYINSLYMDIKIGFLTLSSILLFLFFIMTWLMMLHLSRPIQKIIKAVIPYQQNLNDDTSEIKIHELVNRKDEFGKLATTLHSLSQRVKAQIETLKYEQNEKEAILESLIEGVIAVDSEMTVTYANAISLKFLNIQKKHLINKHFSLAKQPECLDLLKKSKDTDEIFTTMVSLENNSGEIYLDVITAPTKDRSGAILILQDNSIHYRLLEMRKDFIANASHELKTPITIIQGFAEALHDNPSLSQDQIFTVTEKILRNCNRMTSLVKSLLILADIENLPASRLQKLDLLILAENCQKRLISVHHNANVTIIKNTSSPSYIIADKELLSLAIMNLLTNAVKYSLPPAHITITIDKIDEKISLSISDNGIGISSKDLPNIFQRFYRVDKPRSKKLGGSGLGLSIVESIIEKHHGSIRVSSEVEMGSTFTILLPEKLI